jgi:dTDP-4-dehydrorhamnose reductase
MTTRPRLLILGGSGMLGHRLLQVLHGQFPVTATFHSETALERGRKALQQGAPVQLLPGVDALDFESVRRAIDAAQPDQIVNCIGIIKQSDAIGHAVSGIQINAMFPHQLAQLCGERRIRLVHFSTDCVFSGARGNYSEADRPDPPDFYGATKLLGEVDQPGCLTLRTSIVGWELANHRSLLGWFASQRGRTVRGYQRAMFSGLSTTEVARLLAEVVIPQPQLSGIFHISSAPISKLDLLSGLRDALGWRDTEIQADTAFVCDRTLSSERFRKLTGWAPASWSEMTARLARERSMYEVEAPLGPTV